ncbi:hypothetical protein ACI6QG_14425 [Roseococcus sp. DSY-14]|uniref:hypothetical protein n=1 Tax=Roseococcus sp. DSY-14 TaxID=3369650 RepID=UPI00387AF888
MINNLVILLTHLAILWIVARAVMLDRGWGAAPPPRRPAAGARAEGAPAAAPGQGWRARVQGAGR